MINWRAKVEEYYLLYFLDRLVSINIPTNIIDESDTQERISINKPKEVIDDNIKSVFNSKLNKTVVLDKITNTRFSSIRNRFNINDENNFQIKITQNE